MMSRFAWAGQAVQRTKIETNGTPRPYDLALSALSVGKL